MEFVFQASSHKDNRRAERNSRLRLGWYNYMVVPKTAAAVAVAVVLAARAGAAAGAGAGAGVVAVAVAAVVGAVGEAVTGVVCGW